MTANTWQMLASLCLLLASGIGLAREPGIALATIQPGDIYWQRFGHNTLVVAPAGGGPAVSYNFGYFDFEQPDFLTRFLRGRMLYQALALPAELDLAGYAEERRAVHLQSLTLAPGQAERLAAALAESVRPENRDYRYEYFRANCSTRLRDAIDLALDGQLHQQTASRSRGYTYRMHSRRLAQGDFWLATGIDLGLGPDSDRPLSFWEEMFIPEMLRRHLREVENGDGQPLVAGESDWFDGDRAEPPELARDLRLPYGLAGVAIAVVLLRLSGSAARRGSVGAGRAVTGIATGVHLLFGLAGCLLLFLWLGTDHIAAHRNENLFLLSPLSLLLAPLWLLRSRLSGCTWWLGSALAGMVALSAVASLAGKTLPWFIQQNLHWTLLLLPIHLALLKAWFAKPRVHH